jgi:hypothetical protein
MAMAKESAVLATSGDTATAKVRLEEALRLAGVQR